MTGRGHTEEQILRARRQADGGAFGLDLRTVPAGTGRVLG